MGTLLPDRHPNRDFFILDVSDAAPKDDMASMEHPVFSLSVKPDMRELEYHHDGKRIVVVPSGKGLATIMDKDVLLYCISKLVHDINAGNEVSPWVDLTAHELLVATNWRTNRESYKRFEDALDRLRGTTIKTNVKTGDHVQTRGFGLIDEYEIVRRDEVGEDGPFGRMARVRIKVSDWTFRAVQGMEVLTINPQYFRLRRPLERRIYELARKHVGVDRGVAIPYALSSGEMIALPGAVRKRREAQRRAAKVLSRRKRGSKRYAKARERQARLRARDARTRAHVAHVLSRQLVRSYGLVAIEDLKIRNMTASAKGTVEEPGSRVAQKSGLNRAILNIGWYALERMLAYKLEETGGLLVKVPAAYSSQTCAACGHVDARSRESQAIFCCTACGEATNADTNAAKTILARALRGQTEDGRENIPFLDVEASASAAFEASTRFIPQRLDVAAE